MEKKLQLFNLQTHIHGSGGHGLGSHLGYDYMASREGILDVVWWMEHEFRVANFGAVKKFEFNEFEEYLRTPNRKPDSKELFSEIAMGWDKVTGDNQSEAAISRDNIFQGKGSLHLSLTSPGACVYRFQVENHREKFPVFTHPTIKLAIYPDQRIGEQGAAFIEFVLSQQPPDFSRPRLIYSLGQNQENGWEQKDGATIIFPDWQPRTWNELEMNIAEDVQRLNVPGGLDNCICDIKIGLAGQASHASAFFDSLIFEPGISGTAGLEKERELLRTLPVSLIHHVGMEFSYYGQHINCFGSTVPIPDYEQLLPHRFSSCEVVEHIRAHGGLSSINHLEIDNMDKTLEQMAANKMFGADLIEINKKKGGFLKKLNFWDRLCGEGLIITAVTGTDCHAISAQRAAGQPDPGDWINCIWAESSSEPDLLDSLRRGRLYLADPLHFRGRLSLRGPDEANMGDVLVGESKPNVQMEAIITDAKKGDVLLWLLDGHVFQASRVSNTSHRETLPLPFTITSKPKAVRLQLIRPELIDNLHKGTIAVSNPLYWTSEEVVTNHHIIHYKP